MISRYVLWDGMTASIDSVEDSPAVLREMLSLSKEERPRPETLPLVSRLAIRHHLIESGIGAEVALDVIGPRPTLNLVSCVTIAEMGLSVRSYNCLNAASIETFDELLSWTPARLMRLLNFGSKCLSEIKDVVRQFGYAPSTDEEIALGASRKWSSLANASQEAIPEDLAKTHIGTEVIFDITESRPSLPRSSSIKIVEMEMSVRAYNCLRAASIETLDDLLSCTPAQLMELPSFGRKCLSEITEIVHGLGYPWFGNEVAPVGVNMDLPLQEGGAPIVCLLDLRELFPDGNLAERFAACGWHRVADLTVHSVEALVRLANVPDEKLELERVLRIQGLELPVELPTWFLYNIPALRDAFRTECEQLRNSLQCGVTEGIFRKGHQLSRSLNDELTKLIPKTYDIRKRQIVSDLLGLVGGYPLTLDEVAKLQRPALTRERVRQVARPITDALSKGGRELPWLLKAVAALKRLAPCSLKQAEQALIDDGILDAPMTIQAILGLAQRANLEHDLLLEDSSLLNTDTAELLDSVMRAAGKLSSRWGVADWHEIELLVPEPMIESVKTQLREVAWLDEEKRYCVLPDRENSLANRLARILTVTPRLKIAEAYRGVFRDARMEIERLPEALFTAFCLLWPWCSVDGDEVVAQTGLPLSEASGDDLLVLLMREIGHPVRRRELTRRAMEQGISLETVTVALSYSNVISSKNGYFAVVGDPRLEEFGLSDASARVEVLVAPAESKDSLLVPDENASDFPGLLMLAMEERVLTLGLTAPWSVSELRLNRGDRDRLMAWGQLAQWDFRDDFGNYQTKSGERVRKRTALGLAFVLFASEAVRQFGDSGSVWPAIERVLGERQQNLFMFRTGLPKPALREAVETACRTFGLRHGFEDVGQQVWVRTVWLQSGLLCSHIPGLSSMLGEPTNVQPLAIQLLLDTAGPNASASFQRSWKLLQDVRLGTFGEKAALERFSADDWLSPFPQDALLAQCLAARHKRTSTSTEYVINSTDEAYQYFSDPVLRWADEEAYLEYNLSGFAPSWRESAALVLVCEDPFRRERIPIENGRWELPGGPIRVPLTRRDEAGFCFKLVQGKEEVFAGWKHAGLPHDMPFTFFLASGTMLAAADDFPHGEDVVLLHRVDVSLVGLDAPPIFRSVLRGTHRLTRLPACAMSRISLIAPDRGTLWSFPEPEELEPGAASPLLPVRCGKWGTAATVTLPELPFTVERLRLNSGEVLPISRVNGRASLSASPGLGRAKTGRLQGSSGTHVHSARVELHQLGADFGVAIETDGNWRPLDGSATLDAVTLRTHRLLAKVKGALGIDNDLCWMEGGRTLAGLSNKGTLLTGMHGLGEGLNVARGTYNVSQIEVPVACAITDGGFWRSVQAEANGSWSAHLPFEEPLEEGHSLWVWAEDSPLPRTLPKELLDKKGFTLRWNNAADARVFGWAFSVDGARIGSVLDPETLGKLMKNLASMPWSEAAMWLRWWHAPVLHENMRNLVADRVHESPVETIKSWLLPAPESTALVFDELRDEAWAAATREFLWGWRTNHEQAAELVKALGIWTGIIENDIQTPPSLEAVGLLVRMSPILLADAITHALPILYRYPKPQLAVLLGMALETINPNTADTEFRLDELCDRYANGESRLDGNFIMTRLIGAARALLRGDRQDLHNLRLAFHQPGLRALISVALLRDTLERWREGTGD